MFNFNPPVSATDRDSDRILVDRLSIAIACSGALVLLNYLRGQPAVKMGKHADRSQISINAKLAWMIQESPSFFVAVMLIVRGDIHQIPTPNKVILGLFTLHYFNRSFLYTLRMSNKSTPVAIMMATFAFIFTFINSYNISKYQLVHNPLPHSWLYSHTFISGVALWTIGFVINNHSDSILVNLRKPGESGYRIPRGGAFELVSGANFFGEIVEWWGLAIASNFQLPLLCFAVSTSLTIGSRACSHHKWYVEKFEDYPKNRRAVIPFIL